MSKQTKTLNQVETVTAVNSDQSIILTDDNGRITRISLNDLKQSLLGGISLDTINDNVFIMWHSGSNDSLMVKPQFWTDDLNSHYNADGVVIFEGGHHLVIAPDETLPMTWCTPSLGTSGVNGGGIIGSDRSAALNDWDGKAHTLAQVAHDDCLASKYCNEYSREWQNTNGDNIGLGAGKWWLPSSAELLMMYANMNKINYALSLIDGAKALSRDWYWSSSEITADYISIINFVNGNLTMTHKATDKCIVRPVSAFIK